MTNKRQIEWFCTDINKLFTIIFKLKCGKVFHDKMSDNKVNTNFQCDVCDQSFKRKYNLNRHSRVHQEKVTNVVCSECSKTFANDANLKVHFNDVHKGKKMPQPETALVPNKGMHFD